MLTHKQFVAVEEELRQIKPWPESATAFLTNIDGENQIRGTYPSPTIDRIKTNIDEFGKQCDSVVVINLASTEKLAIEGNEVLNTLADFERALDEDSADISPSMLYAYAAIACGVPYGNFTPSVAADIPALVEFAEKQGVPITPQERGQDWPDIYQIRAGTGLSQPGVKGRGLVFDEHSRQPGWACLEQRRVASVETQNQKLAAGRYFGLSG